MMYYFYGKRHNYTVYKFVNWSFLAGTYLHTHILPVYHFVLDFLICCPRRGQNGIPTGDKNQGQGQHPCTPAMHANTDGHVFLSFVVIRDGYLEKGFCNLLLYL